MGKCKHLFVCYDESIDTLDNGITSYRNAYFCVNCGLRSEKNGVSNPICNFEDKIDTLSIYNKTKENNIGIIDQCLCSISEAAQIYKGIMKNHSSISDEDLVKYFNAALHNKKKKNHKKLLKKF